MNARCIHCGRPLRGAPVYLPPSQLRIYHAIRRAGPDGISTDALISEYGLAISPKTLKAHISQINARIAAAGLCIPDARKTREGGRNGLGVYRVVTVHEAARFHAESLE